MRPLLLAFLAILFLPFGATAQQPSFDCAKARSAVETVICGSPALAAADRAMADSYGRALADAPAEAKDILVRGQRAWAAYLNNSCDPRYAPKEDGDSYTVDCVEGLLKARIALYAKGVVRVTEQGLLVVSGQGYQIQKIDDPELVAGSVRPQAYTSETIYPVLIRPSQSAGPAAISGSFEAVNKGFAARAAHADALEGWGAEEFEIGYSSPRLLTFHFSGYWDGGGAHGMPTTSFATILLPEARVAVAADVFDPSKPWRARLAQLCDADLARQSKAEGWSYDPPAQEDLIKLVEDPLAWDIGKGFGVHFPVYAVSSYAEGEHRVDISYSALKDVLAPAFLQRVGLK